MKSTNRLIRHLNAYKGHFYPKSQPPHKLLWYKSHNKKDALSGNWKDEGDLLGKTVITATANGTLKTPIKDTPRKGLFASESLLALREKWFNSHKFPADTFISDKKYKHPRSKHKNSFYPFNDQFDYGLAHYFTDSETTKGNINKFWTDLLMASFTKKLSYKNADEWIKKLLEIP